jgi:hypothetical protein
LGDYEKGTIAVRQYDRDGRGDERVAAAQAIEQGVRHPSWAHSPANVLLRQFAAASGKMEPV